MAQQAIKRIIRNSKKSVEYLNKRQDDWKKNLKTCNDTGKKQGSQKEEEEVVVKNHERNAQS